MIKILPLSHKERFWVLSFIRKRKSFCDFSAHFSVFFYYEVYLKLMLLEYLGNQELSLYGRFLEKMLGLGRFP